MEKQRYLIGDIAQITGLSRDTLRFYEKKGILRSRKNTNGYRYFTDEDLYRLVRVLFSRKMNFGLDTTKELMPIDPLSPGYQETIQRQVKEEMEAIRFHRQALYRLLSIGKIYDKVENCKNRFCMKPFPKSLILSTADSPSGGLKQWFLLSQKYPGMDMVYVYDRYQYRSGFTLEQQGAKDPAGAEEDSASLDYQAELVYQNSCLVLYEEVIEDMKLDYDFSDCETFTQQSCIHTAVEASDARPEISLISAMRRWAADQNLLPSPDIIVTSNFSRIRENDNTYTQEIYIPLLTH